MQTRTISHYKVFEKIGAGGMGVVYKARDTRLDRFVALKFLAPGLAQSAAALDQLRREARVIASLNHPNIATLYQLTMHEDAPVLVMEYLPGGSLHSRIYGRQLSPEEITLYATQLAEGLAFAHQHGVVHRDVKPQNILFTAGSRLKVSDFGLARVGAENELTTDGGIEGTLGYMSPECIRGVAENARSDIFSFGVVLYEMASGRLPFSGQTAAAVLHQILHKSTPSVRVSRPDLPNNLEQVIRRATAKDPGARYQHMEELLCDLRSPGHRTHVPAADPARPATLLLIEDDDTLRGVLELGLRDHGYRVLTAGSGLDGCRIAAAEQPDAILLDVGLPGRNGLDVCRELRHQGFDAPIVFVSGKVEEIDRVVGLEIGADDYVTKPFSQRELLARIRVQLRRRCA